MNHNESQVKELLGRQMSPAWSLALELADEGEPTVISDGAELPTIKVIFDSVIDAIRRVKDCDYTSMDVKALTETTLLHSLKKSVAKIGLLPVEGLDVLPLERILRRANKLDIDLAPEISRALATEHYEAGPELASFAQKALNQGRPEITLAISNELNSIGKSSLLNDVEANSAAFLGSLNAVINAPNNNEANRMQAVMIELMETLPIDIDLDAGGFSISEYCDGEPALSQITSRLNRDAANRIIENSGPSETEDQDVVFTTANRQF